MFLYLSACISCPQLPSPRGGCRRPGRKLPVNCHSLQVLTESEQINTAKLFLEYKVPSEVNVQHIKMMVVWLIQVLITSVIHCEPHVANVGLHLSVWGHLIKV